MEKIYVALIRKGIKTIDDVPEQIRAEVKKLLKEQKYVSQYFWQSICFCEKKGGGTHGCYLCRSYC